MISERIETNEIGSYNHFGFLLGGIFRTGSPGKEFKQSIAHYSIEKTEIEFREAKETVICRAGRGEEGIRHRTISIICRGIPLSLQFQLSCTYIR